MITPNVPEVAQHNIQQQQLAPSLQDIRAFDRTDVHDIIKTFLLRHYVKKEVRQNERQQIVTDVTLYDLTTNHKIYGHNEHTEHFAASINKLPVALLLLENMQAGQISMDSTLTWQVSDQRAGNGLFDQPGAPTQASVRDVLRDMAPTQASVRDVLRDMLQRSGNTAVRIIVNGALSGADAVNQRLAAKPELQHTRLIPLDTNRFYLGNTTSKESLWVLRQILAMQGNPKQDVKEFLQTNIFVNDGFRSQLAGNDFIVLVNKTGLLYDPEGNNVHDVGVIYNTQTDKSYGYAVLTTSPSDAVTPRADQSIKNIGQYTLRYAGDTPMQTVQQRTFSVPTTPETKVLY